MIMSVFKNSMEHFYPLVDSEKHALDIIWLAFYAPGLKGQPGGSSNWIVHLSVRLFVCLSVILSRLQTKCNI